MSLIRCIRLLSGKNGTSLNVFKHSCIYYSSDKKPSDNDIKQNKEDNKTNGNEKQSLPPKTQSRLNDLLKRLSSRSSLNIFKEVQLSKPLGYKQLRQNKEVDGQPPRQPPKPRNMHAAIKAVSTEFGDKSVETEILSRLSDKDDALSDIISTMKPAKDYKPRVGTFKENVPVISADYYGQSRRRTPITRNENYKENQNIELTNSKQNPFNGVPIGIFTVPENLKTSEDSLKTWQKLEQYDLHAAMSTAPRNYFEKMAYWTEEGKIWHFPIDNEQGLDEEHQTSFTEHVFLEEHLEPWCPKKGALRNFMELVCIGLSKNPYYTVQQKREHIEWYRNYFHEKQHILQRVIEANNQSQSVTAQVIDGTKST
ncbi:28S ribosomal protein S31, mitochondrial [Contarinia nasturtii]|uniref:28S ribosomal protein S31, mitochondrial n=1 Tax=Contarinia nasturtii TaxID=265458 RepID=UPI0012D3B826|nr:28S ribosomal protein S31, mitochondrial [Contarinia nasturtii]